MTRSRSHSSSDAIKSAPLTAQSQLLFVVLIAISLAIWWGPIRASLHLALSDEQYTHILLVAPLSAAVFFVDRKHSDEFRRTSIHPPTRFRVLITLAVTTAGVIALLSWTLRVSPDLRLASEMMALVGVWIAASVLCFGVSASRQALFSLLFLFWMIPPTDLVLNSIVRLLQEGSASTAYFLFWIARIPVAQRGMLLHIPGLTLEVAPECSSIRSSLILIITTIVLAHLLLRSPWKKVLVVALAIPLSIFKNGLRIFVLGVLATRIDRTFLTGRLHRQGGVIFFLIALVAILFVIWVLRRGETEKSQPETALLRS